MSKLKAAVKRCRAPPEIESDTGSWQCDWSNEGGIYAAGVVCRLTCNEGYAAEGMDMNVWHKLIS